MDRHEYRVRIAEDGHYDVVQNRSNVAIARAIGPITAQRVVNSINACQFLPLLPGEGSAYQPLTADSEVPDQRNEFFLVRPRGKHKGRNIKFVPSTVQLIDGKLYASDNEIEPLIWSLNGDLMQGPTDDPYLGNLEWMPLPE